MDQDIFESFSRLKLEEWIKISQGDKIIDVSWPNYGGWRLFQARDASFLEIERNHVDTERISFKKDAIIAIGYSTLAYDSDEVSEEESIGKFGRREQTVPPN